MGKRRNLFVFYKKHIYEKKKKNNEVHVYVYIYIFFFIRAIRAKIKFIFSLLCVIIEKKLLTLND